VTSPEGRLRCGRPSTFAVRPCNPSSSDQFQLRCLSNSILPLLSSRRGSFSRREGPISFVRSSYTLFRFSFFPLNSLFRTPILHPAPLSICSIASCLDGMSLIFLPLHLTYVLQFSPLLLSSMFDSLVPIFDSFDPETCQALCMRNRLNNV